jgi:hypothetical protein
LAIDIWSLDEFSTTLRAEGLHATLGLFGGQLGLCVSITEPAGSPADFFPLWELNLYPELLAKRDFAAIKARRPPSWPVLPETKHTYARQAARIYCTALWCALSPAVRNPLSRSAYSTSPVANASLTRLGLPAHPPSLRCCAIRESAICRIFCFSTPAHGRASRRRHRALQNAFDSPCFLRLSEG